MTALVAGLATLGRPVLAFLVATGRLAAFVGEALSHLVRPPFHLAALGRQLVQIGYLSLPVVGLTALFTGMVLALQTYTGFQRFSAESAVASVVVVSITRELGPVLAGLMVAGRVGAAIAAELGTMRVTEQVDALATLDTHPMKYLVVPRLLAGLISLPPLVLVADLVGVFGGTLVGTTTLGFSVSTYLRATLEALETVDVVSGLVKAAAFGVILTLVGCFFGLSSGGGAQGVGAATTRAVVVASALIFVANFFLTQAFFAK